MKKLLRVLVVAALLLAIAIPCLADNTAKCTDGQDHTWSTTYKVTKAATCVEKGREALYCTKCGEPKWNSGRDIPATGKHNGPFVEHKLTATCGWEGIDVYECSTCHEKYEVKIAKNPANHPEEHIQTANYHEDGDCKTKGWKATKYCDACKTYLDKTETEYGEHEWEKETYTPAKPCQEHGWTGLYCDVCGTWKDKVEAPLAAHTKDNSKWIKVSDATCTSGSIWYTYCSVCGEKLPNEETKDDKQPHDYDKWVVTVKGTCQVYEEQERTCKTCGHVDTWKSQKYADHVKVAETVPATCTEDGTLTTKCSVCGKVFSIETLPATGHKYFLKETKAHDCIPGESAKVCSVCGDKIDVVVTKAPKDHVAGDWKVTKAPTCTEKGEEAKSCTVCSKVLETREVAAKGHTAGEYTQTKAPTCTEKGEEVSKCTVCNAVVDTREVAAKGHTAGEWITVRQPSASQNGKMIQKCTVCGAQIGKKYIRANGSADTAVKTVAYVAGTEVANYAKIDLTVDATTELDLVSANGTKVGKLVVEVKEGKVTVKYELSAVPADAFLTFVAEAPAKDIHAQKEFEFEKAISVADELAGAAAAYIYVEIEY